MPAGRPEGTKIINEFTPEQIKQIEFLSGAGFTVEQIAAFFGVSRKTFYRYMDDHPVIIDTIEKGRVTINAAVVNSLYNNAVKKDNVAAQIWWTKSRMGWRESAPVDERDTFKLAYADKAADDADE